jgi:hypothetical protein
MAHLSSSFYDKRADWIMTAVVLCLLLGALFGYLAGAHYRTTTKVDAGATVGQRIDEPARQLIPLPPMFTPDPDRNL